MIFWGAAAFHPGEVSSRDKELFLSLPGHFPLSDGLAERFGSYGVRSRLDQTDIAGIGGFREKFFPLSFFFDKAAGNFTIAAQTLFIFRDSFFIKRGGFDLLKNVNLVFHCFHSLYKICREYPAFAQIFPAFLYTLLRYLILLYFMKISS